MNAKPRLLDLFCGAGGCTAGYRQAGFWVRGVDFKPQRRYVGDEFVQAEALDYLRELIDSGEICEFDVIHASPPCQGYLSRGKNMVRRKYPLLIPELREILISLDSIYVIENVDWRHLVLPIRLCGSTFGLRVYRHRFFESNVLLLSNPCVFPCGSKSFNCSRQGVQPQSHQNITVTGNFSGVKFARQAMGISWMTRD